MNGAELSDRKPDLSGAVFAPAFMPGTGDVYKGKGNALG
jgi:hypothetical protein